MQALVRSKKNSQKLTWVNFNIQRFIFQFLSGLIKFAFSESREYKFEPFQIKALARLTAKIDPSYLLYLFFCF